MGTAEHFLVCTNDYHVTSVGLFRACVGVDRAAMEPFRTFELLGSCSCDNKQASKKIFLFIDELLKKNNLTLEDCSFFGANLGPSPFTTLRTVIASINGLAFATKKPLVGVNGIETLARERVQSQRHIIEYSEGVLEPFLDIYIIALNNAYNNDVYYAFFDIKKRSCMSGCASFDAVIDMINQLPSTYGIEIIGNIAQEKRTELETRIDINHTIYIDEIAPESASLEALGKQAYQQWRNKQNIAVQLTPLYLKQYTVKVS